MHSGDTGIDTVATILSTNWTLFKQDSLPKHKNYPTSPQEWTDILTLPSKHYSKEGNFTVSYSNLVNVAYQLVTQTTATHWLFVFGPVSAILEMPGWDKPQHISSFWNIQKHDLTPCYMLHSKSLKSQFVAIQMLSLNFRQSYWPSLHAQMHCMVGWAHVCVEKQLNSVPNKVAVSVCPKKHWPSSSVVSVKIHVA